MPDFNFLILYVDDLARSAAFYADLLAAPIVEQSPTFATLGLWSRHGVEPKCAGQPGAGEVAFAVADAAAVEAMHADWTWRGLRIAQVPTRMDFGTTFVAVDPDGHRLRVFAPVAA
jgi:catechol 2,3-dioxygenase-like lactoylglutathione lyase family enzyme